MIDSQQGTGNFSAMLYFVTAILSQDGGSRPRWDLSFAKKRLSVIINDDSFEEGGGCYGQGTFTYIST